MSSQKALQIWRKAEIHRKACEIGRPTDKQPFQLCQCCDQIVYTQPVGLCQHSKQFQMFGFGYPLWFSFLKHCILLVFVLIISKTATQIYIATQQNYQFCYGGVKQVLKHPLDIIPQKSEGSISLRHQQRILLQTLSFKTQKFQKKQNHKIDLSMNKNGQFNNKQQTGRTDQNYQNSRQNKINDFGSSKNTTDSFHGDRKCTSFLVYLAYFKQQKLIKDWFLTIIQFFAHLVALVYFRNTMLIQQQEYNENACLISDYTLMICNLPAVKGLKKSIINLLQIQFNKSYGRKDSEIQQLIYVFQDQKLKSSLEQNKRLQRQLIEAEKQNDQERVRQIQKQLTTLRQKIQNQSRYVRELIDQDQIVCDKVFVIMSSQLNKVQVLQKFRQNQQNKKSYRNYFNVPLSLQNEDFLFSNQIKIKLAHEPNQIIWEYIDSKEKQRIIRSLIGWLCTIVVLAIATFIFYFIIKGKTKLVLNAAQSEYQNSRLPKIFKLIALLIVVVALIGILLFNKIILQRILRYIVQRQKHGFKDKQNLSFAVKYAVAIFFTTGLMTLIIEVLSYQNVYSHHLGLIEEQSLMFFIIAIGIPFIWWIHPYNMFKNWERQKAYGKLVLQQEANQLMEDYPYDLSKKHSEIFKLMWLTFLYAELIPLCSFLAIIGLFLYYWVDKYNFLRHCTRKPGISGKMTLLAVKSIDATLFMVPGGSFLFDLILRNYFDILSLVLMILGIVYLLLPMNEIIWRFNAQQFRLQQKEYKQVQYSFRQTYMSLHPVYSITHRNQIQMRKQKVKQFLKKQIRKDNDKIQNLAYYQKTM